MEHPSFHNERREYSKNTLEPNSLDQNPILQLEKWLAEAIAYPIPDATAMVLATRDFEGRPCTRIVLLKGIENQELVFFTDKRGRKAQQIEHYPFVSVNFYWPALERQVSLQGQVTPIARTRDEAYFKTRPRESQISAWASQQSHPIASRAALEAEFESYAQRFKDTPIPCPPHWGGFAIAPYHIEFWQGRPSRLHYRIAYTLTISGNWELLRLSP